MFETNGWSDDGVSLMLIGLNIAWLLALVISLGWNACTDKKETSDGKAAAFAGAEEAAMVPIEDHNAALAKLTAEIAELKRQSRAVAKSATPKKTTRSGPGSARGGK